MISSRQVHWQSAASALGRSRQARQPAARRRLCTMLQAAWAIDEGRRTYQAGGTVDWEAARHATL